MVAANGRVGGPAAYEYGRYSCYEGRGAGWRCLRCVWARARPVAPISVNLKIPSYGGPDLGYGGELG